MSRVLFFILTSILLVLTACKSSQKTSKEDSSNLGSSSSTKVTASCDLHEYDYTLNPISDSGSFPFIYLGNGKSHVIEAYSLTFQLSFQEPLAPLLNYQVPWLNVDNYSEYNGNCLTYVRNGRQLSLENPYIMVQYIRKDVPHFSSIDSVFTWVDGVHLPVPGASIAREMYMLETLSGKTAYLKEYQYPEQGERRGKNLAYAYIEANEEYYVGIVMTTAIKTDYDLNLPLYKYVVKSFCL